MITRFLIAFQIFCVVAVAAVALRNQAAVWGGARELACLRQQRISLVDEQQVLDGLIVQSAMPGRLREKAGDEQIVLVAPPAEPLDIVLARLRRAQQKSAVQYALDTTGRSSGWGQY